MRAMKDSGIECVGDIPVDWSMRRLRFLCFITTGNQDTQDNDPDGEYPFYVRSPIVERSHKYTFDGPAILMSGDGAGAGRIFHKVSGKYACHQRVYSMQNIHDIDSAFLFYYLRELFPVTLEMANAKSTVDSVRLPMLQDFTVLLPSPAEQQRIAAYLDEQCGEIDRVLAKTQESIEEYKKLKQSVITEAVTKGIRPDRPMKPSGIEWIGDIPEEWEVRPFRTILTERNEKNLPAKTEERLSLSIDLGVTKYAEKTTNLDRFKEDVTQYKLAYPGDLVLNSMNMIVGAVGVSPYFGCVSPAYYTYYDKSSSGVAARFCDFLFRTRIMRRVLRSLGKGIYSIERGDDRVNTCRLKVAREDLRALKIPLPSETEQTEIVAHLDQQCAEIDRLIAKKEQIITELESYKKSLIYECVTGKREVE